MTKKSPNSASQRQFRGGYVPQQPVDESNRVYRKEPESPSKIRKRDGVQPGSQSQARPGLVGMQDFKRGKRG